MDLSRLPHYVGDIHPNCDYHHGQITPARGVKCYQVTRANRGRPGEDDGTGHTYKHAADLAFFNNRFYVQYLTNPEDEHDGAGISVLADSEDGVNWNRFRVSFPEYRIKKCVNTDYKGLVHTFSGDTYAFMHQRMCFFKAPNGRLLLLGFYGWSPKPWMTNWDNYGIGRVVREIKKDNSLGPIYFIRVNRQAGWRDEDLNYPLYTSSPEREFVEACDALLSDSLYVQQWAEENGDIDPLIQIKHPEHGKFKYEAFCWYHIDEKTVIGLWKHALTARSHDGGKSWSPVVKSHSLVMSGQKVWAEKTGDGRFAMVYTPTLETQHRYPLCVTTSVDGLAYDNMLLVHGEVPPMKYKGFWKDLGPQYMRGIAEGLDKPSDGDLWMTYTVNKEDVWVAQIPVPIQGEDKGDFDESFEDNGVLDAWNLYSPKWAFAGPGLLEGGKKALILSDRDPYDYSKAERLFEKSAQCDFYFTLTPVKSKQGVLYIEVCNEKAQVAVRLVLRGNGKLYARTVCELPAFDFEENRDYALGLHIDCKTFTYKISVDGNKLTDKNGEAAVWKFMMAVNTLSRFILRTGPVRYAPTLDDVPDDLPEVPLPGCEEPSEEARYALHGLKFVNQDKQGV